MGWAWVNSTFNRKLCKLLCIPRSVAAEIAARSRRTSSIGSRRFRASCGLLKRHNPYCGPGSGSPLGAAGSPRPSAFGLPSCISEMSCAAFLFLNAWFSNCTRTDGGNRRSLWIGSSLVMDVFPGEFNDFVFEFVGLSKKHLPPQIPLQYRQQRRPVRVVGRVARHTCPVCRVFAHHMQALSAPLVLR